MEDQEKHQREMNIGAHIAWAAAMWGSAETSKINKNYINAVIGYYYSVFHIGFSLINTDHTFHMANMKRMNHSKIESWLEDKLNWKDDLDYKTLRIIRENVNYLGMGDPASKLQIVRGHNIIFELWNDKVNFFEMVELASKISKRIFKNIFSKIEEYCKTNSWQPLQFGRDYFINDYLTEDLLLYVIPREDNGKEAMILALELIED